jgi:hypothetical protein
MMHSKYKKRRRVVIMVVLREVNTKDLPKEDMYAVSYEDMEEGETYPPLVSIVEILVMYQVFSPKYV